MRKRNHFLMLYEVYQVEDVSKYFEETSVAEVSNTTSSLRKVLF